MRSRGGVFAIIHYLLYAILGIIGVAISVSNPDLFQVPGFNILFLVFYFSAFAIAICGIVLLVLKSLHMATKFALFGIPCLLADAYIIWSEISSFVSAGTISGDMLLSLPVLLLAVGSFISNVRSF